MRHHRLVAYLKVKNGIAAIKFYEDAFDAEEMMRMLADDGQRILHAELEINDTIIMLSDEFPEMGRPDVASPLTLGGTSIVLHLDFKQPKLVDRIIDQAVKAGATLVMPAQDMFWGAYYGQIRDPFGHVWAVSAPSKKQHS